LKKLTIALLASLTCVVILLPVIRTVNHSTVMPQAAPAVYQADGAPVPPPIPWNSQDKSTLVADGAPVPPPIPWNSHDGSTLIADGAPVPPPIPWDVIASKVS